MNNEINDNGKGWEVVPITVPEVDFVSTFPGIESHYTYSGLVNDNLIAPINISTLDDMFPCDNIPEEFVVDINEEIERHIINQSMQDPIVQDSYDAERDGDLESYLREKFRLNFIDVKRSDCCSETIDWVVEKIEEFNEIKSYE